MVEIIQVTGAEAEMRRLFREQVVEMGSPQQGDPFM